MKSLFNIFATLPYMIAGVQALRNDAKGASKKQIVMESLGLATAEANVVLSPAQAKQADAVSQGVSTVIDGIVASFHAANEPGFGANSIPVSATETAEGSPA